VTESILCHFDVLQERIQKLPEGSVDEGRNALDLYLKSY